MILYARVSKCFLISYLDIPGLPEVLENILEGPGKS